MTTPNRLDPPASARSPVFATTLETDDIDRLASAFARWDHRIDQLGGGKFRGRLRMVDLRSVQLIGIESNRTARTQGAQAAGTYVFSPVLPELEGAYWRGRTLRAGMVNVLGPDCRLDHRTCENYRQTSLVVERSYLERAASTLIGVDLDRILVGARALEIGRPRAEALARTLASALDRSLSNGSEPPAPDELVAELLSSLADGRVVDPIRSTASRRLETVRKVEEYARAFPDRRLGVMELCAMTGVSKRTLHYAFLEVTGCGPGEFVKRIRLNAARRELLALGPGRGHVERVARSHGFDRPGNFAADFRRLFGELPSRFLRAEIDR